MTWGPLIFTEPKFDTVRYSETRQRPSYIGSLLSICTGARGARVVEQGPGPRVADIVDLGDHSSPRPDATSVSVGLVRGPRVACWPPFLLHPRKAWMDRQPLDWSKVSPACHWQVVIRSAWSPRSGTMRSAHPYDLSRGGGLQRQQTCADRALVRHRRRTHLDRLDPVPARTGAG